MIKLLRLQSQYKYIRIKDVRNNASLVDLTNLTVFNDGGNYGFAFKSNSTPGTRGGITGIFTAPALPVSRGGAAPTTPSAPVNNNNNPVNASPIAVTLDRFINPNIKPLDFKPTQKFDVIKNTNIGTTFIPNPLSGIKAPSVIDFMQLPVNFLTNLSKFTVNAILKENKKYPNSLTTYLYSKGIDVNNEQDLAKLKVKPVLLTDKDNVYDSLFKLNNSFVTYDSSLKSVVQKVRVPTNMYIVLMSDKIKTIKYFNKDFLLNNGKIDVLSPENKGVYIISSSNIPLVLDVYEPVKKQNDSNNQTLIQRVIKWTKNVFK